MDSNQISVIVRFFGVLEIYAGTRKKEIILPAGSTIKDVMNKLVEINPPAYRDLLQQIPENQPFLRIMLNETMISDNNPTPLSSGDVIILLPGISGG